jgi:hypothetical protein
MPTDPGFLFLLPIIFGFLWAALQMTGSKLLAIIMMVFCLESLWLLLEPIPLIFWWGVVAMPVICGFYGWWIYEPTTPPASLPTTQVSSAQQSVGIAGDHNTINYNQAPAKKERTEPSTLIPSLSLEIQNALVIRFRDIRTSFSGPLRVTVDPKAEASYSFARQLAALFTSAGWITEFIDPHDPLGPTYGQGFHPNPMNTGIGVTGNNLDLVMTIRGILENAGCTHVAAAAQTSIAIQGTSTPQWTHKQPAIRIEISYRH